MVITKKITHEIYDLLTGELIQFHEGDFLHKCQTLSIDYTNIAHLQGGRQKTIFGRYILPKNKDQIFILTDVNNGKEYECITNKTIFLHLNIPYTETEGKYIYELRKQRQLMASIGKHIVCLKGNETKILFNSSVKNIDNPLVIARRKKAKQYKKLKGNLHSRIVAALTRQILKKENLTLDLLGCPLETFANHLEKQFTSNMNWENYGQYWHIDHIVPCAAFDLFDLNAQYKCFSYKNCRPLEKTINLSKSDSITNETIQFISHNKDYISFLQEPYLSIVNNRLSQLTD